MVHTIAYDDAQAAASDTLAKQEGDIAPARADVFRSLIAAFYLMGADVEFLTFDHMDVVYISGVIAHMPEGFSVRVAVGPTNGDAPVRVAKRTAEFTG